MGAKVDKAEAALRQAEKDLERWVRQRDQRKLDLADAEKSLGDSVIEETPKDKPINKASTEGAISNAASRISSLRSGIEAAVAAVEAAERNVDKARRDVWRAQAAELRDEADKLNATADERAVTTERLLRELRDHEACEYVPIPVPPPAVPGEEFIRVVPTPRTERIRNQALSLIAEAERLEAAAADTPEARREKAEAERKAREEWLRWENEEFERKREEEHRQRQREIEERRKPKSEPTHNFDDFLRGTPFERT